MSGWHQKSKAIIQAWYPGMEGGTALARILFGKVNPSGKLPMTFPKKLEDSPAHAVGEYPGKDGVVKYNEGLLVGYRYFDTRKVEPLFPFGHGLSYSTFAIDSMKVEKREASATVKVNVKNTGSVAGFEVVQLYVKDDESSLERPEKELKAFSKVFLNPGEIKTVEMILNQDAFQFYDDTKKQWVMEPGKFTLLVGTSSRDIRQTGQVTF
jgi:beta-glucosidase